jgi:hypothetical protein
MCQDHDECDAHPHPATADWHRVGRQAKETDLLIVYNESVVVHSQKGEIKINEDL